MTVSLWHMTDLPCCRLSRRWAFGAIFLLRGQAQRDLPTCLGTHRDSGRLPSHANPAEDALQSQRAQAFLFLAIAQLQLLPQLVLCWDGPHLIPSSIPKTAQDTALPSTLPRVQATRRRLILYSALNGLIFF